VVIPAVEAGLQRGTLVMQPADSRWVLTARKDELTILALAEHQA